MNQAEFIVEPGIYLHSKSQKKYEVIGTALHTESSELIVVYKPLYDSEYEYFARPIAMFLETIELGGQTVPRFKKVN